MSAILASLHRNAPLRDIAAEQAQTLRRATGRPATRTSAAPRRPLTIDRLNEALGLLHPGRYALRRVDGGIDFLEIRQIARGRRMVFQLHGAPGDFRRVTLSVRMQGLAALHIAEDPAGARRLFGEQVGECSFCHSPLTQPRSRAAGAGEKCARDRGVAW